MVEYQCRLTGNRRQPLNRNVTESLKTFSGFSSLFRIKFSADSCQLLSLQNDAHGKSLHSPMIPHKEKAGEKKKSMVHAARTFHS